MAKQLEQDLAELETWLTLEQPHISIKPQNGFTEIAGIYLVKSNNPERAAFGPLARYVISVKVFDNHPKQSPQLRETDGAIVRSNQKRNHVNYDGTLCYGPPSLTWAQNPNMSLVTFFKEYVHSYFLGYLHYETCGEWPKGEYEHGNDGVIDAISEILGCKPNLNIIHGLLYLIPLKHRRDRWHCPCGSKKRLGRCCRKALNKASRLVPRDRAYALSKALASDLF